MFFKKQKKPNLMEHAVVIDWKPAWDVGSPCPQVIASGQNTRLIYDIQNEDAVAVVKFIKCYAHKFGGANDEVIHGHPLYHKGLQLYGAHRVIHSSWIESERKIHSVHDRYNPEMWKSRNHYLLLFHDQLFECIAEGYETTIHNEPIQSVLSNMGSQH